MTDTIYRAKALAPDRILLLSFDPDGAAEGDPGEVTRVRIAGPEGLIEERRFDFEAIVDAVPAPGGADVWLLARSGTLWSFAGNTELASLALSHMDQFIGIDWLGADLLAYGSNNLMRQIDPDTFASRQLPGIEPLAPLTPTDFSALTGWATRIRESYAVEGTSVTEFIAARSHGEILIVEGGSVTERAVPDIQTRFAALATAPDGAIWLAGANQSPCVARLPTEGPAEVVLGGRAEERAPIAIAGWGARLFLGDEGPYNGGLYEIAADGLGRRWPDIANVVSLRSTASGLWIVGSEALYLLDDDGLTEVPLA